MRELQVLMGAGGWAYLPTGEADRLKAYAMLFDFEVNSIFYTYPKLSTGRSWRRRVPKDSEFTVKYHRDIVHIFTSLFAPPHL